MANGGPPYTQISHVPLFLNIVFMKRLLKTAMELRHLRYFVAVAEELHFGRAADRLHISQPPLSHQIQNLERELGVELFRRTRHFVALTDAGRVFLAQARHVLEDAEHAIEIAQKAGRGEIGRLSVGFGPAPENGVLKRVLSVFLSRHPDICLDLHNLYTREQIEALASRRIQVGFPLLPIKHRDLVVETVATEPLSAALPAGHALASRDRIDLGDLRDEPFVRVSPALGTTFSDFVIQACRQAGFTPQVAYEAGHLMTVLGFIAAGLGVSILPDSLRRAGAEGVVFRRLHRTLTVDIGLAYRRDDSSKVLLSFLEVVRDVTRRSRLRSVPAAAGT